MAKGVTQTFSPIPTINLSASPYSMAKTDTDFLKYITKNTGTGINTLEFLKNERQNLYNNVVVKLQSGISFSASDENDLKNFATSNRLHIDSGMNTSNVVNSGILYKFFNDILGAKNGYDDFKSKQTLMSKPDEHLVNLFSIIKHCQDPDSYPIKYKQWVNLNNHCQWSTNGNDDYDRLCDLYKSINIPDSPRQLYFAAYMDQLARCLANALAPNITGYDPGDIGDIFNTKDYDSIMGITRAKKNKVILPATPPKSAPVAFGTKTTTTQSTTLDAPQHPLNLILYGPPGTGKTYNTVNKALDIIKPDWCNDYIQQNTNGSLPPEIKNERDYALKEFRNYVKTGQIVFTTFHQSMSYEDFIEGIKPIPPRNNEEQMVYDVQDGLFKQICEKAKKISVVNTSTKIDFSKTRVFKMSLGEKGKDADSVFEYCVENEVLALGWGDSKDFSTCKTRADFKKLDPTWGAAALEIFKEWMKPGDIVLISDGTKEVKGVAQVDGDYEFRDDPSIDMHQFRKAKWLYTGDNIPISKLYDKNLSQQSIYGFYKEKKGVVDNGGIKIDVLNEIITGEINDKKEENYVLIIDEINRGNVAQIFGELITLIEPSKRLGNSEEMKAILPYSSAQKGKPEYFGVPNNLYIIGTMNTADRSVEALDTALRRRFFFEEMMPEKSLLTGKTVCGVDLGLLLETINKRIVALKDREHQIGHSYFMGHNDKKEDDSDKYPDKEKWLTNVFKDKIIPLLQEYFYGDYKKIYYVLGPGFVENSFSGKNQDSTRKELFPFVDSNDQELDISEERYEIRPFNDDPNDKRDNKVVIKAAVHELINSEEYQKKEKDFKEKHKGTTFKKGDGKKIDVKYVIERTFGGENISDFQEETVE